MSIDIELTLNRFGFGFVAANKIQVGLIRFSWWDIPGKTSLCFEINWKNVSGNESRRVRRQTANLMLRGSTPPVDS